MKLKLRGDGTAAKSAWGLLEQITSLVAALLTAFLLARTIGPTAYGAYAGVYALMAPFLAFTNGGVGLAVMDHIVREQRQPTSVTAAYLGAIWTIGPVVAVAVTTLAGVFIGEITALAAGLLIFGEVLIGSTLSATTSAVQAIRGFAYASRVRTFVMANKALVLVVLAVIGQLSVITLAVVQTASFALLAFGITRWQNGLLGYRLAPGRYRRHDLKDAGVYAIGMGANGVQNSYDQTVLSSSHPLDAGRYAAAYRMASLGLVPLAAVASATHTDFLDPSSGQADQVRKAWRFTRIGAAYCAVFAVGAFFCVPIMAKVLGEKYEESVSIMRWLIPLVPLRGLSTFPLNGLLGLGRAGLRLQLFLGGAVLSLVLYFSLIPRYSWHGAVAGTIISEFALLVAAWVALVSAQRSARRTNATDNIELAVR